MGFGRVWGFRASGQWFKGPKTVYEKVRDVIQDECGDNGGGAMGASVDADDGDDYEEGGGQLGGEHGKPVETNMDV